MAARELLRQRLQARNRQADRRVLRLVGRGEAETKARRQPAAPAMLIGEAKRLGGTGYVEQQRMRHDHEQDVDQMGACSHVHLSESDRNLSVHDATTHRAGLRYAFHHLMRHLHALPASRATQYCIAVARRLAVSGRRNSSAGADDRASSTLEGTVDTHISRATTSSRTPMARG